MFTKRTDLPNYKGYKNFMIYHDDGIMFEWYCGYVELPKGHVLYDKETEFDDVIQDIDVHGGVTFMKDHVIGFDCNHYDDNIIVCNKEYVINEIHKMIDQLDDVKLPD